MNRRGFISMLAGSAGALVVPWRQIITPVISIATPVDPLVAITGLELMQNPHLRKWLASASRPGLLPGTYDHVLRLVNVNNDCAFIPRSIYRAHLMQTGPWSDYRFESGRRQYYADMRADARQALADDLLHDWSKDQPTSERIWS